jgi:hypothetical protein
MPADSLRDRHTLHRLRISLALACIATVALALPAFAQQPWLPIGPFPALWPARLHQLAAAALLLLPVAAALTSRPRPWLWALAAVLWLRAAGDQLLWQPYLLQYLCMLIALGAVDWRPPAARPLAVEADSSVLDGLRWILVAIYFWSGFAKLHALYLDGGATIFVGTWLADVPRGVKVATSTAIPCVEMSLAVGLLLPRLRRVAVVGIVAMHALILAVLGPLGTATNRVVWPWNLAMVGWVIWLFWSPARTLVARDLLRPRARLHWAWLAVFGVLPALSYVGLWHPYLSFRLYARRDARCYMFLRDAHSAPPEAQALVRPGHYAGFTAYFDLCELAERQFGLLPPPVYGVFAAMATRFAPAPDRAIVISAPPHWRTGERRQWVAPPFTEPR